MLVMCGRNFSIIEELISMVKGLPMVGIKFYRDKKFSNPTIDNFPKEPRESIALVKQEGKNYFHLRCIKKL